MTVLKRQRGAFLFSAAAAFLLLSAAPNYYSGCRADDVLVADPDAATEDTNTADLLNDDANAVDDAAEVLPEATTSDDVDDKSTVDETGSDTAEEDLESLLNMLEEELGGGEETAAAAAAAAAASQETAESSEREQQTEAAAAPVQSGPFIDLFGDVLLSLEMVDESKAQVHQHYTNEILSGKKVIGLYFSADWCGPCRQFTPDLVNFYDKMNARRGKQNEFEIVWISRCRSVDDFGQYFTHMNWLALPPQEAMGQRGQYLSEKYKTKGIPHLVLLDEIGNVITLDARNKIPLDKAGIGFPWKSPMSVLVSTLVPRSFRLLMKNQLEGVMDVLKGILSGKKGGESAAGGGGPLTKLREMLAGKFGTQR